MATWITFRMDDQLNHTINVDKIIRVSRELLKDGESWLYVLYISERHGGFRLRDRQEQKELDLILGYTPKGA